jgi:hypothetical protein
MFHSTFYIVYFTVYLLSPLIYFYGFHFRVSNFETSAVQDLREKILGSRSHLVAEFQRLDKTFVGLYFKFVQDYNETFSLALVVCIFMPRHYA